LESVWLEVVMVQCTRICIGGNEGNNKATQITIAGLWAEISNVKVHVFQLMKHIS